MSESKTPDSQPAEIRFVSSLPVEEAMQVLAALASPDTPVTLTEVDSDRWRFAIGYYEPGQKRASITIVGVLRRWDGTYTRLDCTSRIHNRSHRGPQAFSNRVRQGLAVLVVMLAVFLWGVKPLLLPRESQDTLIAFLTFVQLSALGVLAWQLLRRTGDDGQEAFVVDWRLQHRRAEMFEDIRRVFRLAGDISQDEDDLDASDDPGLNAVLDRDATGEHRKIQYRR